ncbi:hypothetical protein [Nocardiopsis ansamitocini]|uniref:hypothetical protein n=1 Tax=Nocardiopsis ansamitocini TaxID=1670832 RepID=UPI0025535572|nr:hypothetical protein [Nocardiopsis ansamitocini]
MLSYPAVGASDPSGERFEATVEARVLPLVSALLVVPAEPEGERGEVVPAANDPRPR